MANSAEPDPISIGRSLLQSVARLVHDARFAFSGVRGRGYPEARSRWEEEYRSGRWDYLDSASEVAHYMVIVGYVQQFCPTPAVLDVGCGHGRLFQLLKPYPYRSYLGIDHSAESIQQAQSLATRDARFQRADFEEFTPTERYDVIVFSESIYYTTQPATLLRRYASALRSGGVVIVSMCQNRWQGRIWTKLAAVAEIVHSTALTNERDLTWHVKVLRPRPTLISQPPNA
jgi:2-polyprenyl-3-methyl-5-hydroxy-6-metoxy-1,4-benzoquinol methylase